MKMASNKYIFDDGSLESKLLQHEIPDAQVFKVKPYTKLDNWLAEILEEDDQIKFVYLHFCQGDLIKQNVDIRTEVATALHNYPYLRIILKYEQMDKPSIERRATNAGITSKTFQYKDGEMKKAEDVEIDKVLEENKDKIKTIDYGRYAVGGEVKEVPPAIVAIDPDDEMKASIESFKVKKEEYKDKRKRKKKE